MAPSTVWTSWRTTESPKPIGLQAFSLTTRNFIADLPMPDPVVPCRYPKFQMWNVMDSATQINSTARPAVVAPWFPVAQISPKSNSDVWVRQAVECPVNGQSILPSERRWIGHCRPPDRPQLEQASSPYLRQRAELGFRAQKRSCSEAVPDVCQICTTAPQRRDLPSDR